MIKDNQKYFNRLHLLMDAVVVAVSYLLAWYIKFCTIFADTEPGAGRGGLPGFGVYGSEMDHIYLKSACAEQYEIPEGDGSADLDPYGEVRAWGASDREG